MRVFLTVLDSLGAGALPDACLFGDAGANTLYSISQSYLLNIPNLIKMGIGNIPGLDFLGKCESPVASYGRCAEKSMGKDTVIGHWEIAGVISSRPFPTYPEGFPEEIIKRFESATGRKTIVNKPYSGTDVIRDYGDEHVKTGDWIVYTSADSVFQIAAHERVIPLEELYSACEKARHILCGDHAVGRVIARPFDGEHSEYFRTSNRRDFSAKPSGETLPEFVSRAGLDSIAVGKISDIFAGIGFTESFHTDSNDDGMKVMLDLVSRDFSGLCFINLVDFDMIYGLRRDVDGYAAALSRFDRFIPKFISKMRIDDVMIITADHGCDPGFYGTDHTREYIPLLIYGKSLLPCGFGTRTSYSDISATVRKLLNLDTGKQVAVI